MDHHEEENGRTIFWLTTTLLAHGICELLGGTKDLVVTLNRLVKEHKAQAKRKNFIERQIRHQTHLSQAPSHVQRHRPIQRTILPPINTPDSYVANTLTPDDDAAPSLEERRKRKQELKQRRHTPVSPAIEEPAEEEEGDEDDETTHSESISLTKQQQKLADSAESLKGMRTLKKHKGLELLASANRAYSGKEKHAPGGGSGFKMQIGRRTDFMHLPHGADMRGCHINVIIKLIRAAANTPPQTP